MLTDRSTSGAILRAAEESVFKPWIEKVEDKVGENVAGMGRWLSWSSSSAIVLQILPLADGLVRSAQVRPEDARPFAPGVEPKLSPRRHVPRAAKNDHAQAPCAGPSFKVGS